jgi:molybdopterin-binding protein
LRISARNQFKGTIEKVERGVTTAVVRIKVQGPITVTALITKDAADDLKLQPGDAAEAVIKATEVMIAKE